MRFSIKSGGNSGDEKTILYIQFTNPAAYPPLEHSTKILSQLGWKVEAIGSYSFSANELKFPRENNIRVSLLRLISWPQKIRYAFFCLWAIYTVWKKQPTFLYLSDVYSCPLGLILSFLFRSRILYHEHDSPEQLNNKLLNRAREALARRASLCVLPEMNRLQVFVNSTKRTLPTLCVWNCPSKDDIIQRHSENEIEGRGNDVLKIHYHGTINPHRLPMALLDAISLRREACDLSFVGYETTGHKGYISEFLSHADQKGLSHCVHYLGVLDRKDCLIQASRADIGISFIASKRGLFNMDNMVGASNKIFEYLAVGVMPIVKDEMMWNCAFVPNYAVACNPDDARDLARTLRWCIENRMELRRRANEGAKRIQKEWNYENSFEKVVDFLNHSINDHRRSGG